MAEIIIGPVKSGSKDYTILVYLIETKTIEGKEVIIPIDEVVVAFSKETESQDIRQRIIDSAQKLMDAHKDAVNKHQDIVEMDFPPIT